MLTSSQTAEPLAGSHERAYTSRTGQKYPADLHPIPLPTLTRTATQTSAASFSSTSDLLPHHHSPQHDNRTSLKDRITSWYGRPRNFPDSNTDDRDASQAAPVKKSRRLKAWHGWRYVLFGSWLNVFLLLLPVSWILKLATEETDTLIFSACMISMIPLVKLHDMAINVLSRRMGGTKTGLINASFSNLIELIVAITALRKCELHVVQSSLIGAILSKQLLILGMCFLAGGLRFYQQDYDPTATIIHSSLLSIGVGAVCLPAAFHFALSYNVADLASAGTTLQQQKADLLTMSHGVSFLLLIIYFAYLVFQLCSHTHLYQDNTKPSEKIPGVPLSLSVRSLTQRVRTNSGTLFRMNSNSQAGKRDSPRSKGSPAEMKGRRVQHTEREKTSPVEEVPETSFDSSDVTGAQYASNPDNARQRRTAYLLSPYGATSQVTLSVDEFGNRTEDPTVRLVHDKQKRGRSASVSDDGILGRPRRYSDSSEGSRRSSFESGQVKHISVNEVLSAYSEQRKDGARSVQIGVGANGQGGDGQSPSVSGEKAGEDEGPELSWTMTFILLITVIVLVTINSEWLVDSMDNLSPTLSKEWIGLILLPTISSIAECVTAVNVSVRDQLTLSISVAVGSSIQTTLFVIPFMVLLGWILDKPLPLLFDPFETVVLYISVHIMGYVMADGKSNWLEGVILISLYLVIAVTFWFYPGSSFSSNLAVCVDAVSP
ncbi:Sodium/calcium exchanger protein-domain-containing protein [Fomitopsis serialis]|uniref:Sodium/calcium exchanger protein-domain-containing protein n=1 Tax=Fomitopsis serialis TaxID=139415 RepID=UPI0020081FE3|nr:Sodium/calcium exchanger protein-domain-containing protein [Neoantrodia serialis]KAH9917029.1 Sodium/calcium exchanger protein-domain-containing protein [Neoantrodia serialis]